MYFLLAYFGLLCALSSDVWAIKCNENKVNCVSRTEYQVCVTVNGEDFLTGPVRQCQNNQICLDNGEFPCVDAPIDPKSQGPIIPAPDCFKYGIYEAEDCHQYWECVSVWFWWEPRLRTCADGSVFDRLSKLCSKQASCGPLTTTTTTTTTKAPVTAPPCYHSSKHPGPQCDQYFECVSVWLWWEPREKTCPNGYGFDPAINDCNPAIDCYATTTSTPETTTLAPITPPACYNRDSYPGPQCNQYYQCENVWFWYEPRLKTCPDGEGYDDYLKKCSVYIDCSSGSAHTKPKSTPPVPLTTKPLTESAVTTTSSLIPNFIPTIAPPLVAPSCSGPQKYPTPYCNQYWECVNSWLFWFEPRLQTCPLGSGFNPITEVCTANEEIGCNL